MKQLLLIFSFFILFSAEGRNKSFAGDSLDAHAILNKAIEAQGGKDFLGSIKTLYTNTVTRMDGIEVNWVVKEMLPNKGSFQVVNNNRILYQSWFDGKNGFEIVNGKKRKQNTGENNDKIVKKNIISEMDYVDSSLWTIKLVGQENVLKQMCYKIYACSVNGIVKYLFYSKQSFLLLKEEKILSPDLVYTFFFMSFVKQGQLTFCNEIKLLKNGKYQEVRILDMAINKNVDDTDFR